jgi:hypothetical protein
MRGIENRINRLEEHFSRGGEELEAETSETGALIGVYWRVRDADGRILAQRTGTFCDLVKAAAEEDDHPLPPRGDDDEGGEGRDV